MAVSYSVPTTTNHIEREIERDFVGPGLGGPRSRHGAYHVDIIVSRLVTLTLDPCNQERDDWREMSFGVRQCRPMSGGSLDYLRAAGVRREAGALATYAASRFAGPATNVYARAASSGARVVARHLALLARRRGLRS